MGVERDRLALTGGHRDNPWYEWGPYVSERQWASVREDYSADGDAWTSFPHDHARSRAYRWGEDALAGICDRRQGMCLGLALWNGHDPILKERAFGLGNAEGNHGEDAKDYWFYSDAVPSSAWLSWVYHYPQAEFPYGELVAENARRGVDDPEYELIDTGVFDDGAYWIVRVDYAKATPDDICMRIRVRNAGSDRAVLHVLPTLWFRNTWSWGQRPDRPGAWAAGDLVVADHPARLGRWVMAGGPSPAGGDAGPRLLFCENETNTERLFGVANSSPYPKDGINDHVVHGAHTVDPAMRGTKAAMWYTLEAGPREEVELRVRLRRVAAEATTAGSARPGPPERNVDLGEDFERVLARRGADADEFYEEVIPAGTPADEALVIRRAYAGLLWSRQFYRYDVARWLDGDPNAPAPSAARGAIRNGAWSHLDANDVILMPDKWEYPWFASWDLAFHCVTLASIDAGFAKDQLLLLTREWFMHPSGSFPAYEWNFDDANPPVHAWAAMRVFEMDGRRDITFLERMFHKLLINFTWWVNRKDAEGNNVFEGGFLGLDNIGPFNRSKPLPAGAVLEQSDGTAWMAMFCLNMLDIALTLAAHNHAYEHLAVKFLEHFVLIAEAMDGSGLWDEQDGFYYDVVRLGSGDSQKVRVRSMVGLIPLLASTVVPEGIAKDMPEFRERVLWFFEHRPAAMGYVAHHASRGDDAGAFILSVVGPERLRRVLARAFDEEEFLSPYGLRSMSRWHEDHPATLEVGGVSSTVTYEPAESRSRLFGGNSNWRGPVWFPLNALVIEALGRYHAFHGDDFTLEYPTGSGDEVDLRVAGLDLARRLGSIFLDDQHGRRPVFGGVELMQRDPAWHECIAFHEYFNGDDGAGLGASHQTGWTALVALLLSGARRAPGAFGVPVRAAGV